MVYEPRFNRHGRGVRRRSRARTCSHAQPTPSTAACHPARTRPVRTTPAVSTADWRHAPHTRTDVRADEGRADGHGGAHPLEHSPPMPSAGRGQRMMLRAIDWYQQIASGRLSPCRFYPSCSEYGRKSIEVHGGRHGLWLTIRRLARCRPFGPSGFDPVPPLSSSPRSRS